jgi:hypothetical protein
VQVQAPLSILDDNWPKLYPNSVAGACDSGSEHCRLITPKRRLADCDVARAESQLDDARSSLPMSRRDGDLGTSTEVTPLGLEWQQETAHIQSVGRHCDPQR